MNTVHKKILCKFCNKEITVQNFERHQKCCELKSLQQEYIDNKYHLDHDGLNCKFCTRLCKSRNALVQHELRCKENPNRKDVYKEGLNKFRVTSSKAICPNRGKICITNGVNNKYIYEDECIPEGWYKGNFYRPDVPNFKGKHHSKEIRKQIGEKTSISRLKGIAEGTITPATCKRFTNSFIEYEDGTKKFLRSSYELIIAIFLDICGIEFTYESIRAPYIGEDNKQHTFISDFVISDKVLEVKGNESQEKLVKEAQAFKEIGYELRVIHEEDVFRIRDLLNELFDIKTALDEVKHKSKLQDYYIYKLSF